MTAMQLRHAGENAILISFATEAGDEPAGPREAAQVRAAVEAARDTLGDDLIDLVPSYASLLVIYDALRTDHLSVTQRLQSLQPVIDEAIAAEGGREIVLPVYYSAERQTAIYPVVSPGGWNLIGNCPQRRFDPEHTPPMPVAVGDRVRFEPIDRERFLALGGELS